MFGWTGKILNIDMTRRTYAINCPAADFYHRYMGGKGITGQFLRPHITKPWDHPDMPLIFATGPLVATRAPTSGRMMVASRSPLTGTVGDASAGGSLGFQIKRAGYDAVVISGQADHWTGITIDGSDVSFQDSENLHQLRIRERLQKIKGSGACALIGPAAENGVRFASIMIDGHHTAGRGGLGLVMGNKKLHFLRVHGNRKPDIYDETELQKAREEIFRLTAASPVLMGDLGITHYGTAALFDLIHIRRMMPTDNFRRTYFKGAETINAYHYRKTFGYRKTGCNGCHILCKKKDRNDQILPEYETMSHFHALINNYDMSVTVRANHLCNDLGMDTISAGATLACHSELVKKTIEPSQIEPLLEDIAFSRGVGRRLKYGSFDYAAGLGLPQTSMSVKKMELPAYDPRGACGMALGYALSTRGGCHLGAYPISHEILRKPVATDRFTFSGKARIIKIAEDVNTMADVLTACKFIFFGASLEEYARAVYAVTGLQTSGQDLIKTGERICYNEHVMNALNGFSSRDDDLPERFFIEPGSDGDGIRIPPLERKAFLQARANYYRIRGLDEDGLPTAKKCKELDLKWTP